MDDLNSGKIGSSGGTNKPINSDEGSIPFDDKPIPFDDGGNLDDTVVSRTPVNLGTSSIGKDAKKIISSERITGTKTFCAKLHAGSIEFIDERINGWLVENPGVIIKRTNTVTGMVVGKKTEPYIIVTIWY